MTFMEPQITARCKWVMIDGPMGIEYVPTDVINQECFATIASWVPLSEIPVCLRDYCENRSAWTIEILSGFGARFSAPGYLDCTPWAVLETEAEAEAYLEETYGGEDNE